MPVSARPGQKTIQLKVRKRTVQSEIVSILEGTGWPAESNNAVQDLLRMIELLRRPQSGIQFCLPGGLSLANAWLSIKQGLSEASATYDKGGAIEEVNDQWGRGASECTRAIIACQKQIRPFIKCLPWYIVEPEEAELRLNQTIQTEINDHSIGPLRVQSADESRQEMSSPRAERFLGDVASPAPASTSVADVGDLITWICPRAVKVNGHFCDVFEGTHSRVGKVALKRPRIGAAEDSEDVTRRFQREAATWQKLQHPHILAYLGTFQRDGNFYFVSPFIENGTLVEYIALHLSANRIKLLCETGDAITYLHAQDVIHGDIKASNLLIGNNEQVLLCDFGLTRTTELRTSTAMKGAGTLRWQSPELWDGCSKSFKSDVYAFGMTIAEVLTGNVPFPDLLTDGAVIRAVLIKGMRPAKSPAVSSVGLSYENVWAVAEACWPTIPEERISMSEALQQIQEDL